MKKLFLLVALALTAVSAAAEDWCTVVGPEKVEAGVPFEIKITTKGAPTGGKIGVDLHYSKKDGKFGGFLMAGSRLDFTGDGNYTFKFKTNLKADAGMVLPIVFLSPDGGFAKNTKLDRSSKLAVAGVDMPKPAPGPSPKPSPAKVAGIVLPTSRSRRAGFTSVQRRNPQRRASRSR